MADEQGNSPLVDRNDYREQVAGCRRARLVRSAPELHRPPAAIGRAGLRLFGQCHSPNYRIAATPRVLSRRLASQVQAPSRLRAARERFTTSPCRQPSIASNSRSAPGLASGPSSASSLAAMLHVYQSGFPWPFAELDVALGLLGRRVGLRHRHPVPNRLTTLAAPGAVSDERDQGVNRFRPADLA